MEEMSFLSRYELVLLIKYVSLTFLSQLWGQCVSLGPDAACTTNLEYFMILVRVHPEESEDEPGLNTESEPKANPELTMPGPSSPLSRKEQCKSKHIKPQAVRTPRPLSNQGTRKSKRGKPDMPESPSEGSGFAVSSMMKWTDPRALTCLVGLCFMALDKDAWGQSMADMLCPKDERPRITPELDADGGDEVIAVGAGGAGGGNVDVV